MESQGGQSVQRKDGKNVHSKISWEMRSEGYDELINKVSKHLLSAD